MCQSLALGCLLDELLDEGAVAFMVVCILQRVQYLLVIDEVGCMRRMRLIHNR